MSKVKEITENIKGAIDSVKSKKYSEFEDAIRKELMVKMNSNPNIKRYSDGIDRMNALKSAFAQINKEFSDKEVKPEVAEPVVTNDPQEPQITNDNAEDTPEVTEPKE